MEQCPDFAQTDWYNPFGKGEIPVQGRCWNEEIGAKYHRLPDRAEKVVRKALWDLSCQSAGLYIKFTTNASKIQVKYTVTSGFLCRICRQRESVESICT